jgi:hypothetical protein
VEASPTGRWVRFHSEKGAVLVVEAAWESGYLIWCGVLDQQEVMSCRDTGAALRAGSRLASRPTHSPGTISGSDAA